MHECMCVCGGAILAVTSPLPCIDSGSVTALWPIILDQFSRLCLPPLWNYKHMSESGSLCGSQGLHPQNLSFSVGLRDCTLVEGLRASRAASPTL